ncbi:hypothetical protein [Pelagimonas varians]|uniref:Uncharacterized protein n=1 Tax=Pelagimonas varians TaxID=696760 RepID=A0A238K7A8_9RHOB|nr:hypothetical protein [Pelagimonas varians]PYG31677.1 hypothetical protein C8N36_10496 [Pelagimonas varians]SMX38801.1 hypothetical protein PEV8663_01548 [Pelagimonas varians]
MTLPISGSMSPGFSSGHGASSLTNNQKQGLTTLLGDYDTATISDEDAKQIVAGIRELEISSGKGLATALAEAGIDAGNLAEKAGLLKPHGGLEGGGPQDGAGRPGGAGGPPGGGGRPGGASGKEGSGTGANSVAVEVLNSVLETMAEEDDSSTDTFQALLAEQLEAAGLDPSQPIMDLKY